MPRRTPQYDLIFNQMGDLYSAADDLDRMTVIDNQLKTLSRIVGDGVLTGWTISLASVGGLTIEVSPGSGFIGNVVHETLTIKEGDVFDNSINSVYLVSRFLGGTGGFTVALQGPSSPTVSDTFVDTIAPAVPTSFSGSAVNFDVINLFWDANSEADFEHYEVERDTAAGFPSPVLISSTIQNGVLPNDPLQDTGLSSETAHFYRIKAVDTSGNESAFSTIGPITTLPDTRLPAEPTALALFQGNGQISVSFDPSPTSDVTKYIVTVEPLNPDGSPASSTETDNGLAETLQVTGLVNGTIYRIRVQSVRMPGSSDIRSSGVVAEISPASLVGPSAVTSLAVTPGAGSITLSWTASVSASGSATGQKSSYLIRVVEPGKPDSSPIDIGLVISKKLNSFNESAVVGIGPTKFFEDDTVYLFKVSTADSFGNESGPVLVKSTTVDTTVPLNPRSLFAEARDSAVNLIWKHSQSEDVVRYEVEVDTGAGFGTPVPVGFVEEFEVTSLTNNVVTTFRLKSVDDASNKSSGTNTVATPVPDLIPPEIPSFVRASPGDEHVRLTWSEVPDEDFSHFLVLREAITQDIDVNPNSELTVIAGSEVAMNVGAAIELIDIDLTNGQNYSYRIRSVDFSGNESDPTGRVLVIPSEGLNEEGPDRLEAPQSVSASFSASPNKITVSWEYDFFGATLVGGVYVYTVNASAAPTAFNVYRSTDPLVGFQLVSSINSGLRSFVDTDLLNGIIYYYRVTAVRDTATLLIDTGSVAPANSLFLGTVESSSGSVVAIENEQRIAEGLESTLTDETLARLLLHRHLIKPLNNVSVDAVRTLSLIDINDLSLIDLDALPNLSTEAREYFEKVDKDPTTGADVTSDDNIIFIFSPNNIFNNVPFIGDFQLLIDAESPTDVEFTIDEENNSVVFSEARSDDEELSVSGLGLTFYVPAILDVNPTGPENEGFQVSVNGTLAPEALVDERLQTVRFLVARSDNDVVAVEIDAKVPDFGTQEGARQIALSPQVVLNDFVQINSKTFESESGNFESGDNVIVLVNGAPTDLDYFVDFENKSVIFTSDVATGTQVALDIRDKEEVQGELPADRIIGLDASQFKTGQFSKPQLPDLSHTGRLHEQAFPAFSALTTDNNYVYTGTQGIAGTSTTPYSVFQDQTGQDVEFLIGSSTGILRSVKSVFLKGDDDASVVDQIEGLSFSESDSSDVVGLAALALPYSGRLDGDILVEVPGASTTLVTNPALVELDDGKILLTGGIHAQPVGSTGAPSSRNNCFIFDSTTSLWAETGSMAVRRVSHAVVLLPSGKVLVSGGERTLGDGSSLDNKSCELFNPALGTWSLTGSMDTARSLHSMTVLDPSDSTSDVVVAGGRVVSWSTVVVGEGVQAISEYSDISSCERFAQSSASWSETGSLNIEVSGHQAKLDDKIVVDGFEAREIYDADAGTWAATGAVLVPVLEREIAELDGPVKHFFEDSYGALLAVTRNSVFESNDGGFQFTKMKGFSATGVVHRVSELDGILFAATDLGVYTIEPEIREGSTWFQSGLIGAGTTETFDLSPLGDEMVAATEIGVFASTDGVVWTQLTDLDNVFNVEVFGEATIFAQSGQDLYRTDDAGANWVRVSTQSFFGPSSIMVARDPLDLFVGTPEGLFVSQDGISFDLVYFDFNRDSRRNNVHSVVLVGSDVFAGYDNVLFAVGPAFEVMIIADFVGTIPTVRVNGEELRSGFRYDTESDSIIFEIKRLSDDIVEVAASYSLYKLTGGGWYAQNPSAPVQVFVDKVEQPSQSVLLEPRLGQIAFQNQLNKFEVVTVNIAGTTLRDEGELFHDEVGDKFEKEKGLPLSLGRNYTGNLLQLGLSIEHNFWERGLERNQYYCLSGVLIDRSFNSFWSNSEFYILGRREFDSFNSTIDYRRESYQTDVGAQALVPLSSLEVSPSELYVGTDNSIFVLDPSASFAISDTISLSEGLRVAVRDLQFFGGDVLAATSNGLFTISDGGSSVTVEQNIGNNLPLSVFAVGSLNNRLMVGTDDTVYNTDSNAEPPFGTWFRSTFTELGGTAPAIIQGTCNAILVRDGIAFAAIGSSLFTSTSGQLWERIFRFEDSEGVVINKMATIAEMLFLGTNKGVYNDRGTARSDQVNFELEPLESTSDASKSVHVNDLFAGEDTLFAATDSSIIYSRKNEDWSKQTVAVAAVHEFIETSGGRKVAMSNNQVFVE